MAGKCSDWFYGKMMPLCAGGSARGWKRVIRSLKRFLYREQMGQAFGGILCVGERIAWFGWGQAEVFLLNRRGQRRQCHKLGLQSDGHEQDDSRFREKGISVNQGVMESGIGILLTTHGFVAHMSEESVAEILDVEEMISRNEEEFSARLSEFLNSARTDENIGGGAVLLCVKEEK